MLTFKTMNEAIETFRAKLATDRVWALRGAEVIYQYQTESEKVVKETTNTNNVGFNKPDARKLSGLVQFAAKQKQIPNLPKHFWYLTPKQIPILFAKMPKYTGQLILVLMKEGKVKIEGK